MISWDTVYRVAWGTLTVLALVGATVVFVPKWSEYRQYQRRQADAVEDLRQKEEILKVLKMKQDSFDRDPRFVQSIAHDLGLAKTNEIIFKFQDDLANPAPTSPARRPR